MKQLTRYEQSIGDSEIDDELRRGLIFLRDRVVTGGPRRVLAKLGRTFHLCTDASFEQGSGGLGRVLYDEWGKMLSFFAEPVSAGLIHLLNPEGKQTIIFELEALAVLVGSTCLLDPIALEPSDKVAIFIDNSAALSRLVSGVGSLCLAGAIFNGMLEWEYVSGISTWYERVASHSNVADPPSRGNLSMLDAKC